MLTQDDINFIKTNRSEMLQGRTEPVQIIRTTYETDAYTKERTQLVETTETVYVVWEEYSAVATVKDYTVVDGVDFRRDTALVSFDLNEDLLNVKHIVRKGIRFEFLSINEKGIGAVNRIETVVRRVY